MGDSNNTELDLLETKSHYEKFVIYLPSKFFNKSSIFKSIYQRIRKKLRYKGIMTYDIDEYAKNLSRHNNYCNSIKDNLITIASEFEYHPDVSINHLLKNKFGNEFIGLKFDDLDYPSANVLYIHLFGGYYYNDKIYSKKKFELERELLFFIAGNLGVSKITYTITNKETVITKIKSGTNIQNIKTQFQFSKTHTEKESSECTEIYENNGAPILFDANGDIKKLEKEIKKSLEPINSPIFNYGFYKSNPKMVAFVCKRFLFKMNTLDYTSESEDVSDMSLTVQSCFADYGLQVAFESSTTNTENVTYKLEFHKENNLLETYFQKKKYNDSASDPFVMIRKFYDEDKSANKIDSKNMIKKYIITLANKCIYKIKSTSETKTFAKKLDDFIKKSESKLSIKYQYFYTSRDIKKWFNDNLLIPNREEIVEDTFDNPDYQSKHNEFIPSNLEKQYEAQITTLENQLRDTIEQFNIYQKQQTEYSTRLKLQLKDAHEQILENQISKEIQSTKDPESSDFRHTPIENTTPDPPFSKPFSRDVSPVPMMQNIQIKLQQSIQPIQSIQSIQSIQPILSSQPVNEEHASNVALMEYKPNKTYSTPMQPIYSININSNTLALSDALEDTKQPIQSNKLTTEDIVKENEEQINRYRELRETIEMLKTEIKNKIEQLEKIKNTNKDKITESLIELSSCQNSLQSLRSRRVMEQIKQTSNKNLDDEEDTFDKLKGMFSRANATVNNIDKQISKTAEKCKKLEEDITLNKNELITRQDEIEQLTRICDENLEEKSNLEQELLDKGISITQLNNILAQSQRDFNIDVDHISNCSNSSNIMSPISPISPITSKKKSENFFSRTFSKKPEQNHISISSV